jgi:hypothetical protein
MSRPSLLKTTPTASNRGILDSVDDAGHKHRNVYAKRWHVCLLAPVAIVCVWAFMVRQQPSLQAVPAVKERAVAAHQSPALAEAVAAAAPVEGAAFLMEDQKPVPPPAADVGARQIAPPEPAGPLAPFPAIASAPRVSPHSVAKGHGRATAAVSPEAKKSTPKTDAKRLAQTASKGEKALNSTGQARPRPAGQGANDPDVNLLSALMQHMGSPTTSSAPPRTLAEQLSACQRGSREEHLACQRQLCAGLWGQSKVCPAHLAPKAATPTLETRPPG